MRSLIAGAAVLLALSGCTSGGTVAAPRVTTTVTATVTVTAAPSAAETPSALPQPSRAAVPAATFAAKPVVAPDGRRCPDHPTPACTGLPPGTKLTTLAPNDGPAHKVETQGAVLDGVHVTGDLLIAADDVKIVNSRIDGAIMAQFDDRHYIYSISDSTVGPEKGCLTVPAIGAANYTAERVQVRGHADAFRDSGDSIVIKDSYARLCSDGDKNYSDGIQSFHGGRGLLFDHNTLDMRDVQAYNAPIFFNDREDDGTRDVTITNNLVMGGNFTIQLHNIQGYLIVKNNLVVDGTWEFAPISGDCRKSIQFEDNFIVRIDDDYRVTSIARPLTCNGK
ncbi:hypothetical protein [Nonomuraea sp. NPDC050643]|uniref:hypothetical protein n=1 Tax=Nonomuraea sp. NPDC050643 TaxID=3155660 RepID=UPI0033C66BEC